MASRVACSVPNLLQTSKSIGLNTNRSFLNSFSLSQCNFKPLFVCKQRKFYQTVQTSIIFQKKSFSNTNISYQLFKNSKLFLTTNNTGETPKNPETSERIEDGLKKISERKYEEAIKVLKDEIKSNDGSEKAFSLVAYCYQQLEDFDSAIEYYIKALNLNKKSPTLYNNIGVCFRKVERFEEAIEAFTIASKIEPNQSSIYENKGVTYDYLNNHEKAVESYNKSIELEPSNPSIYNNKAYSLFLLNRLDESLETYNKSIEIAPSNPVTHYYKGTVLERLQRWEEAITSYNESLEINPLSYLCQDSVGVCYLQLNQFEKALNAFTLAVQINPSFHVGIVNRAYTLRLLGRIAESVSLYLTVLPFFPKSAPLIKEVKKLQEEGKEQEASDLIESFIKSRILWETATAEDEE